MKLIKDCWQHIEYVKTSSAHLEEQIHAHLQPYRAEYERLQHITEGSETTAAVISIEIGVDID